MYCQKCGKEIKENIRFCPGCGAPVKALEEIGAEAKTERKPEAMKENQQPQKPKKKKGRKMIIILLGICVLAIAILIAVFSILKQRKEKMFASNIEAGNNYLEQLDYEKAEDSFLQAIKINPKEKEPYAKLSELYIANDEVEKAQNIVAQAIENIPKEDKKEFQTKQEEWKNLEDYTWVVNPEIEADDIYYLRGRDFYKHSDNEMKRQLYNEYAVIRQGTTYGLIDMDGNWYKDLKCNVVKTILDYYEIETKNPIYSEEFETDMNDYYIKDGQLVAAVAVYGDSYGAQGALENSWIIVHLKHKTIHLILRHQFFLTFFCIRIHGTELINFESTPISSNSFLTKKNRSRRLLLYYWSENNTCNTGKNQPDKSTTDIHNSFHYNLTWCSKLHTCRQYCIITKRMDSFII